MRTINITLEDQDFDKLTEKKGTLTWEKFIMKLAEDPDAE